MLKRLTIFSLDHPKRVIGLMALLSLAFASAFPFISIDTDPENMLEHDQVDRAFYDATKERFRIQDMIVVGIFDDTDILRPASLEAIRKITDKVLKIDGINVQDVVSFATSNNAVHAGEDRVRFHPVVDALPRSPEEVETLRKDISDSWPFVGRLISIDKKTATALYLPIKQKDQSHRISLEIQDIVDDEMIAGQTFHVAGLPIAEDQFGIEMFIQMAIVAPLAFGFIMIIVFLLFRRKAYLLPLGMDAMFAVMWAMGALIATGNTVHIMSSMIPVFLMPISLLDDIHVLSEFEDRFRQLKNKRQAMLQAMEPLYKPMLQTTVTSAVGFGSLALTDIPPVRVFGIFVAFGICVALLLSLTVVPAVISLMSDEALLKSLESKKPSERTGSWILDGMLKPIGRFAFNRSGIVVLGFVAITTFSVLGVQRIVVNDNPVRWFKSGHALRQADDAMNANFSGTYMAYLVGNSTKEGLFKEPAVLEYMNKLQRHLEQSDTVGVATSVVELNQVFNLRTHNNDPRFKLIPDSREAIAQFYFMAEMGGDPYDLDMCMTKERDSGIIWVQMRSGDNRDMQAVEDRATAFFEANPPPEGLTFQWSGLTYINKVWQELMVVGMLRAIIGSFLVVLLLMVVAFRSIRLGLIAMIPLSLSILFSFGILGWVGKDYDMPVAVCATLALGMAIDFAIHYIQRYRTHLEQSGDMEETNKHMTGDPGRAILRNAIVITLGFLPLLFSSLTPYVVVGLFFASLMFVSTLSTLLICPALLKLIGPRPKTPKGA